tara:strand:- start:54 stop:233 length:180 start_codon:yes stop_codon:yes gene_type:complete
MTDKPAYVLKWKNKWVAYSQSGLLLCMVRNKDTALAIVGEYKQDRHLKHKKWRPARDGM